MPTWNTSDKVLEGEMIDDKKDLSSRTYSGSNRGRRKFRDDANQNPES